MEDESGMPDFTILMHEVMCAARSSGVEDEDGIQCRLCTISSLLCCHAIITHKRSKPCARNPRSLSQPIMQNSETQCTQIDLNMQPPFQMLICTLHYRFQAAIHASS